MLTKSNFSIWNKGPLDRFCVAVQIVKRNGCGFPPHPFFGLLGNGKFDGHNGIAVKI